MKYSIALLLCWSCVANAATITGYSVTTDPRKDQACFTVDYNAPPSLNNSFPQPYASNIFEFNIGGIPYADSSGHIPVDANGNIGGFAVGNITVVSPIYSFTAVDVRYSLPTDPRTPPTINEGFGSLIEAVPYQVLGDEVTFTTSLSSLGQGSQFSYVIYDGGYNEPLYERAGETIVDPAPVPIDNNLRLWERHDIPLAHSLVETNTVPEPSSLAMGLIAGFVIALVSGRTVFLKKDGKGFRWKLAEKQNQITTKMMSTN